MKMYLLKAVFYLLLVFVFQNTIAQPTPAFWNEIRDFRSKDSTSFPEKKILFAGSSSFRMWTDMQEYFPGYQIINRGFGGSSLTDMIRYIDDIIYPYAPKQLLIYCGENDLASSDTVTASEVLNRFKTLFTMIREKFPAMPLAYVSIKPSPSRRHLMPKMKEANSRIKKFLTAKSQTSFIDVYHKMLSNDGSPLLDIWKDDSLHMNPKGYAIWQKAILPHLKK